MINESHLTDASMCPSCHNGLTGPRCHVCGIDLSGELGVRLWTVSTQAAALLAERQEIVGTLRAARASMSAMAGPAPAPPAAGGSDVLPQQAKREANLFPPLPPPVRPESAPRSVQDVLLGLGSLLLAIAGVVFVAVSWGSMGIGGRSAILGGFTALVVATAAIAHRRELTATAEAVGALAVLLALVDAYGLSAMGLIDEGSGLAFWTIASATIAVACGLGAAVLPLLALRLSAAFLAQVSGWLLALYVGIRAESPAGSAVVLAAVLAGLVLARGLLRGVAEDARLVVMVGQPLIAVAALMVGTWAAYDAVSAVSAGTVALLTLIPIAVVGARLAKQPVEVFSWSAVATASLFVVLVRPQENLTGDDAAAAVVATAAAVLCLLLAVLRALPATTRAGVRPAELGGAVAVAGTFAVGGVLVVAADVARSVVRPLAWITEPWREPASVASADVTSVLARQPFGFGASVSASVALLLLALAVALVAGATLLRRTAVGLMFVVPTLTLTLHVALLAASPSLAILLAAELAVGVFLCAAAAFGRKLAAGLGGRWPEGDVRAIRLATAGSALAMLAGAAAWSLVTPALTLVVLPVVIATFAVAAVVLARPTAQPAAWADSSWSAREMAGATAAVLALALGGVEVLAAVKWLEGSPTTGAIALAVLAALAMAVSHLLPLTRVAARIVGAIPVTGGALGLLAFMLAASAAVSSAQPLTVVLAVLTFGALAAATAPRNAGREAWAAAAAALLTGTAAAAAAWSGLNAPSVGLVVVLSAALLLLVVPLVRRPEVPLPSSAALALDVVVTAALAIGVAVTSMDSDVLWIALLVAGVATAVVALRPHSHGVGWVSGVLIVASTWVRLADSGVEAPEAYTAPGAIALLVVGWFKRRRNPAVGSWAAYGSGLSLLLVPSFLKVLADGDGDGLRSLLLGLLALSVVLVGASRRLQAPLVFGATVLALHALIQFGPDIVFSTVPKWVTLGSVGLLLLTLGATYERRLAELRRMAGVISRMD